MERYEKTLINSRSCEGIAVNHLSLSKDKTGFFITSRYPRVLSEKIKLYQGDQSLSLQSFSQELHAFQKKIVHGAIEQIKTPRPLK
jgi:hypothetical protein